MNTKLYRSNTESMLAGVCGGLAHYLNIDVSLVRLVFVLLAFGEGIGILLYFILWLIMPTADHTTTNDIGDNIRGAAHEMKNQALEMGQDIQQAASSPNPKTGLIVGSTLIILGVIALLNSLNIPELSWITFDLLWPLLLIGFGVAMLARRNREL